MRSWSERMFRFQLFYFEVSRSMQKGFCLKTTKNRYLHLHSDINVLHFIEIFFGVHCKLLYKIISIFIVYGDQKFAGKQVSVIQWWVRSAKLTQMNVKFLGRDNYSAHSSAVELSKRKNIRFPKIFYPPYFRRLMFLKATKAVEISFKLSRKQWFLEFFFNCKSRGSVLKIKISTISKTKFRHLYAPKSNDL
jgi:hypothetical protein